MHSLFQFSYLSNDGELYDVFKDPSDSSRYKRHPNFDFSLASLILYWSASIFGGILAGVIFLAYERGLSTFLQSQRTAQKNNQASDSDESD